MTRPTPIATPRPAGAARETTIRTTCPYCGVGCGVLATPDAHGGIAIKGDPDHPANRGRLCVKGAALGETLGTRGRLKAPTVHGQTATWDVALDLIAAQFTRTIAAHGPDSVALYVSGQLLTEDYYVANKLMKGFIGSANIDTNSRLCMASSVAGHRRAFGTDTVPGQYEDLEIADLVVLVGSNLAWCHPVLHQRLMAAKATQGTKIVVIDPRRTATCEGADLHLALAPGADAHLFNLLLCHIFDRGLLNRDFLPHVTGVEASLAAARHSKPGDTGIPPDDLAAFLALWAASERVVTVYSQGINQSDSGTDKVNAIINCHLATGRIGRPGMGPLSVTGQPNAMGGREVGGLANMLACHLELDNPIHRDAVQGFWASPRMPAKPGLKAVDMFRAVEQGQIKALWVMHTNPAVTMPDASRVAGAIAACDFVAVSDIWATTDTARLAHVLLPATGWGEKDGTVTNSERMISRQRAFIPAPGQARADWWQLAAVARRMGFPGFDWASPAQIFAEYSALSGVAGQLGSDFDISALQDIDYDHLAPVTWPQAARKGGRFFGDGQFHTPDRKARMLPVAACLPAALSPGHPFRLNTGRVRDHWHTMTRTGLVPRLQQHLGEPYLEINPDDAARLGLAPATLAEVTSPQGRAILRVLISDRVAPGHPFAPMHWTAETAPTGRIDTLVAAVTDPISGQPASKSTPVAIRPYAARWHAFAVSRHDLRPSCEYWAKAQVAGGVQMELAGAGPPADWAVWASALFDGAVPSSALSDPARGMQRFAFVSGGRLQGAVFVSRDPVLVARAHLAGLLGAEGEDVLAGRPGIDQPDPGPAVCACLNIGRNTILRAIAQDGALSVEALGECLGAGTSCGSCRPELAALIFSHTHREAAE
ncbi:molybdopterin-dependent oxidoreductase [Frigidibacter albus]|uniref:Molybdopterin-dependent oxidoreductase n=1 Tax=Frigidibacter albus TaxID=1465486 RepID=A0A6L8VB54_9RHOB|nr:nitrate reductase [Frigidibacter albus]MZQ87557.1 molybdopterin-dependent oxidoreductase [Frigidibacter albus]NBE29463.1 molybdopterin-dependent oxidoreductase [Frigidibacter albus]GGH44721.1 nitrate reductase [Frigidibacter albus]